MRLEIESLSGSTLDHALSLASFGFKPVFVHVPLEGGGCSCNRKSCGSPGKHPILNRWQAIATSDPIALREQRSQIAIDEPNLGVVLGQQTGGEYVVAIDVDDRERFVALLAEHGELPETVSGESGRGSRLFFALSPDVPLDRLKNITGLGGVKGVDVKAAAGQVVVAPSLHESGKRYTWTRGGDVALLPPAWATAILPVKIDPPKWIAEYTPQTMRNDARAQKRAEKYLESAVMDDARLIASCQKGLRNSTLASRAYALFSLCAGLYLGGSSWDYVRRELDSAGLAAGLPAKEVRDVIARAEKKITDEGVVRVPVGLSSSTARPMAGPLPTDGNTAVMPTVQPVSDEALSRIKLEMDRGFPAKISENVARLLQLHPAWSGGPAFDTYSQTVLWPLPLPAPIESVYRYHREIVDADLDAIQGWIMALPDSHRVRVGTDVVHGGVRLSAAKRRVDLLSQFMQLLPSWDQKPRIDSWTIDYLGCPDTKYIRSTGRAWIIAAIERALAPGGQVDMIPVLEGKQGIGKNRSLEVLFDGGPRHAPWLLIFAGHELNKKETKRLACTRWILHDDEFQGRGERNVDRLKSWASERFETYRVEWDKTITTSPRRSLLICSTNEREYLHDSTGNRRWFPWLTGKIRVNELERDRLQLFAEAKNSVFTNGEKYRDSLSDDVKKQSEEETEARRREDPLVEQVKLLLSGNLAGRAPPTKFTTHSIGTSLGYGIESIDRSFEMKLGAAMRELGYEARRSNGLRIYEKV
jgi:hypothetical protein